MPLLTIEKLTMRFGGITAVSNLDLAVEKGQIFSIIGPNGAGKTTVFNAVTGIYEPTTGRVLFMGKPLETPFSWKVVLGALEAAARRLGVDLLDRHGLLGEDDAAVRVDLGEAAGDEDPPGHLLALPDLDHPRAQQRHQEAVVRQDAEVAGRPWRHHHVDPLARQQALRRHQLERDLIVGRRPGLGHRRSS